MVAESDDGGWMGERPKTPLEAVLCCIPLEVWAVSSLTSIEADLLCQDHVEAAWRALEEGPDLAARPVPASSLSERARRRLRDLAAYWAGRRIRRWSHNLPLRGGPVPLWLYERAEKLPARYELRSPGRSEFVGGVTYYLLKRDITGQKVFFLPARRKAGG